jgi:hypothetical protein
MPYLKGVAKALFLCNYFSQKKLKLPKPLLSGFLAINMDSVLQPNSQNIEANCNLLANIQSSNFYASYRICYGEFGVSYCNTESWNLQTFPDVWYSRLIKKTILSVRLEN